MKTTTPRTCRLSLTICGTPYAVIRTAGGFRLRKPDGVAYDVRDGRCTCPDCEYRGHACKHVRSLRAWGLLPEPAPFRSAGDEAANEPGVDGDWAGYRGSEPWTVADYQQHAECFGE